MDTSQNDVIVGVDTDFLWFRQIGVIEWKLSYHQLVSVESSLQLKASEVDHAWTWRNTAAALQAPDRVTALRIHLHAARFIWPPSLRLL